MKVTEMRKLVEAMRSKFGEDSILIMYTDGSSNIQDWRTGDRLANFDNILELLEDLGVNTAIE